MMLKERVAAFKYTGYRTLIYFKYLDRGADHTLVAEPGAQYEIMATESDLPVPPGDGRWEAADTPPPVSVPKPKLSPSTAGPAPTKDGE